MRSKRLRVALTFCRKILEIECLERKNGIELKPRGNTDGYILRVNAPVFSQCKTFKELKESFMRLFYCLSDPSLINRAVLSTGIGGATGGNNRINELKITSSC